jgi:YYY domain-containing protein
MEYLLALYWVASVLALAAAAVPICARLFSRFPDRGAALAPGVAFALLGLVAYWVGHVRWGTGVAALSVLSVFVLGAVAARNAELPDWRTVVAPLGVFLAAFAFFVAVRAVNPAVAAAGGEKFLDFALLESIFLAESLPPKDPWFAGKRVRYYYGGILSLGAFSQAIGVAPKYAYNLGLATCYAALTTGAYGVAAAVADHRDRSTVLAGLLAVLFVGLAGPLATPVRVLLGFLPADLVHEYGRAAVAGIRMPLTDAFATATHLDQWNPWIARYVVPDTITVTPMWSYLNGDLHAHVIAPIFLVPAIGVAFEGWRAADPRRRAALLLGVLPVFAGALAITSTWSLPTAAGIGFLALALADPHPASVLPERARQRVPTATDARGELSRYALAGGGGLVVGLVGAAFAAPFLLFQAPPNEGIGWLPPRSPLGPYLLAFGTFLAVFVAYLARRAALTARRAAVVAVAWCALLAVAVTQTAGAVAVLVPLLGAAWYLRRTDCAGFAAVLVVAGAGLLLAVEVAYAKVWPHDPRAPRWNTVYKVSMQVAVIWGLGTAVAAASLLEPALERARVTASDATPSLSRADWMGVTVAVLVVLSATTFPALALSAHFDDPPYEPEHATLDATDYVEDYHPQEAEAFDWLRSNVDGQPAMLTAGDEPIYQWLNAPSVFTGIPAVVGWKHEKGYRPDDVYEQRVTDVRIMFTADQPVQAVLFDKYDVQYVYYGPVERERYPEATFGGPGVEQVFQNEDVTIYSVDPDAACAATNLSCFPD